MAEKNSTTLKPKEESFVLAYLKTSNASEAYRQSHPAAKRWKASTVHEKASRLLATGKVQARLSELQSRTEVQALLSLEEHMAELQTLREMAKSVAQFSAAIKAEELRGKLRRFYVELNEHTGKDGEPIQVSQATDELVSRIARLTTRSQANGSARRDH